MSEDDDKALGSDLSCFIVGPIGDKLSPRGDAARLSYENATQMWENVFEPACDVFGLSPVRADKIAESGEITEQIFTYLRDADVVIADLSGGNANVMYELGLRHTRNKITIQIGENERLPFDVTTIRTIKFKRTEAGLIDVRDSLIEALRASLKGGGTPVTATRVWTEVATALDPADVARLAALSKEPDDPYDAEDEGPGTLDILAAGEEAMEQVSAHLGDFSRYMSQLTEVAEEFTPRLTSAESFAAKLTVTKAFADALQAPAEALDAVSDEYLKAVEGVDLMVQVIVNELTEDPEGMASEEAQGFLASMVWLSSSAAEASVAFTGGLQGAQTLRKQSTLLKPASKSIVHSLNTVLRGNAIVVDWAEKFRAIPGWVEPDPETIAALDGEMDDEGDGQEES